MSFRSLFFFVLMLSSGALFAQDESEDIVAIIDDLTVQWDETALTLETYDGLKKYCRDQVFRDNSLDLLNKIHHYDTTLYLTVKNKYDVNQDAEAKATLSDIQKLEEDYTTQAFLSFLRNECIELNDNEKNKNIKGYQKHIKKLEKELAKYVEAVKQQVDVIDEHVHHLKNL